MRKPTLLLAGLIGVLPLTAALAAEEAIEGPYLDAGTGANFSRDQRVYNSAGQQVGTLAYDGGVPGTIAAGYAFANGWRGDLELGFRRNDVEDGASLASDGTVDASTALAMLWFDWPVSWKVRPSFGMGAGQAQLDLSGAPGAGNDESDRVFAWQATAGLVGMITRHLALSLTYRQVHTDEAQFAGSGLRTEYASDAAMLGLRYFFRPVKQIRLAEGEAGAGPRGQGQAEAAAFEVVFRPVNFKFDDSELTEPARQSLDELAGRLAKQPNLKVVIDGHTDFIGSNDYNMALGERRANAVRDYLAAKGVDAKMLDVRTFGETRPAEDNATAEGRTVNRRAEFAMEEAAPPNVKIVIGAPTEASKEAAEGDPLTGRGQPEPAPGGATEGTTGTDENRTH